MAVLIRVAVEGCGRGYTESEVTVFAALDGATRAFRRPDNSLVLGGSNGELVLFTQ
ncbi:MAG: hypothetical protein H0W71_07400 [Sphingomonas sp.]|nr:hypothetical protein [Sphingomonas sp.]